MKYLIVGALCLITTGCATLDKQTKNYETCVNDPACLQQIQAISTATTGVAGIVSGVFQSPISVPITALLGLIATLMGGVWLGSKKNKPKAP